MLGTSSRTLLPGLETLAARRLADDVVECDVRVAEKHPHVDGHFDGFPILPAVSQVELALALVQWATGRTVRMTASERCKFTAVLQPGRAVTARVELEGGAARWTLSDGETVFSRGRVYYEPRD